jgi:membrane protease subunit HflC
MKELQDQDYQQLINSRVRNVLGQEELQTLLSKDRSKQMELIKEGVNNEAKILG